MHGTGDTFRSNGQLMDSNRPKDEWDISQVKLEPVTTMNGNEFDVHDLTDAIGAGEQKQQNVIIENSATGIYDEGLKFDFEIKRLHSDSHRSSTHMMKNDDKNLLEAEEINLQHL